jgi:hypothetical protein
MRPRSRDPEWRSCLPFDAAFRQMAKHRSNEGRRPMGVLGRMAAQQAMSTKTVLPVTVVWMSSWAPGVPESNRL